jgi:uncharacterized protein (DUF924 family)
MVVSQSTVEEVEPPWVGQVLHFWFEELGKSHWFTKSPATDAMVRDRFLGLHEWLLGQEGQDFRQPRRLLAAVIVLDQFSRNIFRDRPSAYSGDRAARQYSRVALELGFDLAMSNVERHFLYLPFEHSENRDDQALAVRLIGALGDDEWTRFAVAHQSLIDRFGRFPHRNAILGRESTDEELEILRGPMGSF